MRSLRRSRVTAIDKHIGHRLRTRRLTLDMTQSDLSRLIGLTFQQVQKYEKGANRISASTLQELAAAVKVPLSYFFDGAQCANVDGADFDMPAFLATPDGLALCSGFARIESKALRRAVVELVKRMGTGGQLSLTASNG
jgi:transcriptional regulator with XRE-family HTH domain